MKSLGALAAHYAGQDLTLAYGLRITRSDAVVYGFTSHHRRARIAGVWYEATQGLDVTGIATSAGLEVDNLELSTLDDGSLFTHAQVRGGVWQNARFVCFRYNWAAPPATLADTETLVAGTFGQIKLLAGQVTVEMRGLQQYLQQPVGAASSKTCRARLGDALCGINIASYTITPVTVTAVTSDTVFTASGFGQVADYAGEGEVRWITGANAGLRCKIKTQTAGGIFTLSIGAEATIVIGDTFTAIAGCRKRLTEDCKVKFSNVLNFQGEPHRPGVDAITAQPDQSA